MREENQADIEFSESDDISILNLDVGQFYKDIEKQLKTMFWANMVVSIISCVVLLVGIGLVLLVTSPVFFRCEIAVRISRSVSPVSPDSFPMDETNDPRGTVVPLKFPSFQLAFRSIWINSRVVLISVYHSHSSSPRLSFM